MCMNTSALLQCRLQRRNPLTARFGEGPVCPKVVALAHLENLDPRRGGGAPSQPLELCAQALRLRLAEGKVALAAVGDVDQAWQLRRVLLGQPRERRRREHGGRVGRRAHYSPQVWRHALAVQPPDEWPANPEAPQPVRRSKVLSTQAHRPAHQEERLDGGWSHARGPQQRRVETEACSQVCTRTMAGEDDPCRVAAILFGVLNHPPQRRQ
mmetsp:Transcript_29421/g.97531  ORF Transcript_29421/g.97531 Transcript_29421/m.97531 type:complete len:211 (-) Transcript_29421:397-1029(-)